MPGFSVTSTVSVHVECQKTIETGTWLWVGMAICSANTWQESCLWKMCSWYLRSIVSSKAPIAGATIIPGTHCPSPQSASLLLFPKNKCLLQPIKYKLQKVSISVPVNGRDESEATTQTWTKTLLRELLSAIARATLPQICITMQDCRKLIWTWD